MKVWIDPSAWGLCHWVKSLVFLDRTWHSRRCTANRMRCLGLDTLWSMLRDIASKRARNLSRKLNQNGSGRLCCLRLAVARSRLCRRISLGERTHLHHRWHTSGLLQASWSVPCSSASKSWSTSWAPSPSLLRLACLRRLLAPLVRTVTLGHFLRSLSKQGLHLHPTLQKIFPHFSALPNSFPTFLDLHSSCLLLKFSSSHLSRYSLNVGLLRLQCDLWLSQVCVEVVRAPGRSCRSRGRALPCKFDTCSRTPSLLTPLPTATSPPRVQHCGYERIQTCQQRLFFLLQDAEICQLCSFVRTTSWTSL